MSNQKHIISLIFYLIKVNKRGGKCIPVQCDHENDKQIEQLFKQIEKEQSGQLDLLVNNAYKGVNVI
jgi:dehydrogenase/reductase SDR family member 1